MVGSGKITKADVLVTLSIEHETENLEKGNSWIIDSELFCVAKTWTKLPSATKTTTTTSTKEWKGLLHNGYNFSTTRAVQVDFAKIPTEKSGLLLTKLFSYFELLLVD